MRFGCFLYGPTKMFFSQIRKKLKRRKLRTKKSPLVWTIITLLQLLHAFFFFWLFFSFGFFFFCYHVFSIFSLFFYSLVFVFFRGTSYFLLFFFFVWFFWVCSPLFLNICFSFHLFLGVNLYKQYFLFSHFSSQPNNIREN